MRTLLILSLCLAVSGAQAQRIVDKNKGDHFQKRRGSMDGNLVETI